MRKLLGLASLLVVSLPLVAVAQPPPPPPPPPGGGGGGGTGMEATEPKMQLGVGVIAGLPQSDMADLADTSPGVNLDFAYMVIPNVSIKAGIRYFVVQVKGDSMGVDVSNYDFDIGGRYTFPISPAAKAFGEAMLVYSTISVDAGGQSDSESGVGFGARAGGYFNIGGGRTSIGAAVSYTTADINDGTAAWLGIEGFASFGF